MNLIPIESVLDINDPRIVWADLGPHYKGYQISNTGIIRSMKFYKKHPFGTLVSKDNRYNTVTISNSLNQSERVNIENLIHIGEELFKKGIYCGTRVVYTRSRNPQITSQSKIMQKRRIASKEILSQPSGFHFKTLD